MGVNSGFHKEQREVYLTDRELELVHDAGLRGAELGKKVRRLFEEIIRGGVDKPQSIRDCLSKSIP